MSDANRVVMTPEDTPMDDEDVQKTGQTVQERETWFEVAQDKEGKWHWVLWSANGRQMARNAMQYNRQSDVTIAIKAFVKSIAKAKLIIKVH